MNPTTIYTEAASDADEVCSVYAFKSTSYGAQEMTKTNAERDAVIKKENWLLREEMWKLCFELSVLLHSLEKASAARNVVETGKDAFEKESVYAYEKPNEKCPIGWHEFEGCHCGKLTDYYDVEDGDVDADDAIESDNNDALEKKSVYAYEKPNTTCPFDWHAHEGCFCGKPADYNPCEALGNDETCDFDAGTEDAQEGNNDGGIPDKKSDIDAGDGNDAIDKNGDKNNESFLVLILCISLPMLLALVFYYLPRLGKPFDALAGTMSLVGLIAMLAEFDTVRHYFKAGISTIKAYITKHDDDFNKSRIREARIANHGTNFFYKLVTDDYTIYFFDAKRTVITDKYGSTITLFYKSPKKIAVNLHKMPLWRAADIFEGVRDIVDCVWPEC